MYDADEKSVTCLPCADSPGTNASDSSVEPPTLTVRPSETAEVEVNTPASGTAGASAAREFQRRHDRRIAQIDKSWGRLAGVVKFLTDDPQSVRAWAQGSRGERELASALTSSVGDRAVFLHDRRIPRSSANIDHLAISSSGVWVIDAKRYSGLVEQRDKGGWFSTDYKIYVGGRDQTRLVKGVHKQLAVVSAALESVDVPIHGALCFVDAEWRWFSKPWQHEGVWVIGPRHLSERISAAGRLSQEDILSVANTLAEALPPMTAAE